MNEQLCVWLDDELRLSKLAGVLRDFIRTRGTVENFVTTILKFSNIYPESEMIGIQNVLEKLKSQKSIERQKYKGDNLLESGETEEAILVYQGILAEDKDETVGSRFYAQIYACLGAAYGRLFLYQESAKMYDRAYQMHGDVKLLKPYLYASYKYMSMPEYAILLTKNTVFAEINTQMRKEMEEIKGKMQVEVSDELMEKWKRQYRRSHV
jgi:tetratricopeptide (TPR) repeat protein